MAVEMVTGGDEDWAQRLAWVMRQPEEFFELIAKAMKMEEELKMTKGSAYEIKLVVEPVHALHRPIDNDEIIEFWNKFDDALKSVVRYGLHG